MKNTKKAVTAQNNEIVARAETSNTTKKAKSKATKANLESAAKELKEEEVQSERKTKYLYPEGCSAKEKKDFRRQARAEAAKFEKSLKKLKKDTSEAGLKALRKEEKAFENFKAETYSPEEA